MIEDSFTEVYDKFKMEFYRSIFSLVREREGSLTAMEAFSVEVINGLQEPTVSQFADFLGISQSNATYKVSSLIKKGYLVKQNSDEDRREYHLVLSDKYHRYIGQLRGYISTVMERINSRFPEEDLAKFDSMLEVIADELMPEAAQPLGK